MKKEDQKVLKVISKVLSVLAIIGKVCTIIGIVGIAISMVDAPFAIKSISVDGIGKDAKVAFKLGKTNVVLADNVKVSKEDMEVIQRVTGALKNNSEELIIVAAEACLAFTIAYLVIMIIILSHAHELFENIYKDDTPFKEENAEHLKMMAILTIVALVLQGIPAGLSEVVFKVTPKGASGASLTEILMLFVMSYIFRYGTKLQSKSKMKIYDELKEEK